MINHKPSFVCSALVSDSMQKIIQKYELNIRYVCDDLTIEDNRIICQCYPILSNYCHISEVILWLHLLSYPMVACRKDCFASLAWLIRSCSSWSDRSENGWQYLAPLSQVTVLLRSEWLFVGDFQRWIGEKLLCWSWLSWYPRWK